MNMSISRGRGWLKDNSRMRPNKNLDKELTIIEKEINSLDLINLNDCIRSLSRIMGMVKCYCTNSQNLQKLINHQHSISLEERSFGQKFAALCGQMSDFEVEEVKFRDEILKVLQKDFEDTSYCPEMKINSMAFLGEIFFRVRINNGCCINVLAEPIIQNLSNLLSMNENNLSLFTRQIAIIGNDLNESFPKEMTNLFFEVRKTLLTRPFSQTARCWLLISLDLNSNKYVRLSENIEQFYQKFVDPKEYALLNGVQLKDIVIEPSPYTTSDFDTVDSSQSIPKENKESQPIRNIEKNTNDLRDKLNASKNTPKNENKSTGRNFRSSTNNDIRKPKHLNQEKNPALRDLGPNHKAWMHDDRFYQDYNG